MGKIIAAYGGGFKPPTKGHLQVVKDALAKFPEIDEFIIYVGSGTRDGISQLESILVWEVYNNYLPMKVKIEPSKSPIGDIIRLGKNNPQDTIYFVIGSREGNEEDQKDYESRTKNIEEKYPNVEVKLITTPNTGISGTKARKALLISPEEFYKFTPEELNDKERGEVFDTLRQSITEILNENASYSGNIDYKKHIVELTKHMLDSGMNIKPLPKVIFVNGDSANARQFLGKTAYYDPNNSSIVLYTEGRHPKDIVRSFSHEMIHHIQNLEGRLGNITTTNTQEDDNLNDIEAEANLKGTMTFRNWTDSLNEDLSNISLDYIKTKLPKLDSYPKSDIILSKGDFVYLEIPQDANNPYSMVYEIKVFDIKDGTLVAQSSFDYDDNNKLKGTLDVRPDKRRMGIATEIYKLAEKIIGDTIFPEEKHTEDAEKFWRQKNRSFGPQNYDSLNEAIVGDKIECDNCDWSWKIADGGDDLFICHKCGHDNSPLNEAKPYKHKHGFDDKLGKDPFGLNQYARELAQDLGEEILTPSEDKPKLPVDERLEYYKNYYTNLSPSTFDITTEGENIIIGGVSIPYPDKFDKQDVRQIPVIENAPEAKLDGKSAPFGSGYEPLNEGRYDKISNQVSREVFTKFKEIYDSGAKEGNFSFSVGPDDEDIFSEDLEFNLEGYIEISDEMYQPDGGANAGYDDDGEEITPLIQVSFKIPQDPKEFKWSEVSFDIKDIIRHEIEHLTQDGENLKSGKYLEDDQLIRKLINAKMLPKSQYFKLEKEVDAMLQGLYFRAKKSRTPFKEVILNYFKKVGLTKEEQKQILDVWRSRRKALALPTFENTSN